VQFYYESEQLIVKIKAGFYRLFQQGQQ